MSKTLGWIIKVISWIAIYFVFTMVYDGEMPFYIYLLVVFLCVVVAGVVNHFVKENKTKETQAEVDTTKGPEENAKTTE